MLKLLDNDYIWDKNYKKLPNKILKVPNLNMFGKADFTKTNSALDTHYHPDCIEMVVLIKGTQQYIIEPDNYYFLNGGNVFTTYLNEPHGTQGMPQAVCQFFWFQINLSSSENFLGLGSQQAQFFYEAVKNYRLRIKTVSLSSCKLLTHAFEAFSSGSEEKTSLGHLLFLRFMHDVLFEKNQDLEAEENLHCISKITSYINKNIVEDIRLDELADICGFSLSYFKTKFKEATGITPREYINFKKIDNSKILLKNPDMSITDVAYHLNFSSSNYFASVFKQFTGITPTEYKAINL